MLKVRVIPTILYRDSGVVKGRSFDSWRRVSSLIETIRVYTLREVDELVFLDIAATPKRHFPDLELISEISDSCIVPLSVGGGIKDVDMVRDVLKAGADKVVVNSAAYERPKLISEISDLFGSQCVIASIDVCETKNGYRAAIECGTVVTETNPVELALRYERDGAGEIIITSIPRDGTMQGYDTGLIRQVSDAVSIPVIASGGAGEYEHMYEALTEGKANAVASAAMYHFTDQTPRGAKLFLRDKGIPVRL